ncbi:hypothetical protein C0389_01615 [bacterium]|nr:hypothetical protein [bacterium]
MKRLFAITILSLLVVGCIQYHEKMKLNFDGSGEITFAIGLSEPLFNLGGQNEEIKNFDENKIKKSFANKKGIRFINSRTYTKDSDRWVEITLGFESLQLLMESNKDSTQQAMIGSLSLEEDSKGNMVFTRKISRSDSSVQNDSTSDAIGTGMMEMMFGQYKWKYELTVPGKIISTNAEPKDVDHNSNTLHWTLSMASLSKTQIMTVTFEKAGKANLTLIILGCTAIIFLAGMFYISVTKKKNENKRVDS